MPATPTTVSSGGGIGSLRVVDNGDSTYTLIVSSSSTSPAAPTYVVNSNPSTVYSGQQTATVSATALPAQALTNGVVVTALSTNTGTIYIGPAGVTSSTGYPLVAGQSISYSVSNLNAVYILDSVTTDKVAFTGN